MAPGRIAVAVASTALVVISAVGSGVLVATGEGFYRSLDPPPWQPADAVFGIIWPYNFAVLIATVPLVVVAWRTRPWAGVILLPYLVWLTLATSLAVGYATRN